MGLADTSSHFIWALALLAVVAGLTDALQATAEELGDGRDAQEELRTLRLSTRFSQATWCHNEVTDTVKLDVTNVGERVLDPTQFAVIVDGVAMTTLTASVGDAGSTTVWAPGERARLSASGVATMPSLVGYVTPEGAFRPATQTLCRELSTIVLTPSDVTLDPGQTQDFTLAGYDQYGDPFDGAPYTWSTDAGTLVELSATSVRLTAGSTAGTGFTVTATSGGVTGVANVTIVRAVHVDSIATYNAGVADSTFLKRETVETRVVIRDSTNALVQDATVAIEIRDPSGVLMHSGSATTDANGVASISYTLPNNAAFGTWTDTVTSVSGTGLDYRSADNVVTQVTFEVVK